MFPRRWFDQASPRFRSLFWREQVDQELDEELQYHLERGTQRNIDGGMTAAEARRVAILSMGGLEQVKEECRDARGMVRLIQDLGQDIRYGLRLMRKAPVFSSLSIVSLGLAIGAATIVFSLIWALLVRPLPYPAAQELVLLWEEFSAQRLEAVPFSAPEFADLEKQTQSLESLAAFGHTEFNLTGSSAPERVQGAEVSPNLFSLLQVTPIAGRVFMPNEGGDGVRVVVISERLWQRRFNSSPSIIGSQITLNDALHTVVGIMPASFKFPLPFFNIHGQFAGSAEIWKPISIQRAGKSARSARDYGVIGRLSEGATIQQLETELDTLVERWQKQYPANYATGGFGVNVYPLHEYLVGKMRRPFGILLGAVLLVVFAATANVTAMMLARVGVREREIALRTGLGAGPLRVLRQILTESTLLSLGGGIAAIILGGLGLYLFRRLGAQTIPRLSEIGLDWTVALIILAMSCLIGILIGLLPAKVCVKPGIIEVLKEGGRGLTRGARRVRLRNTFVVAETAFTIVLLVSAGSLIKSFARLQRVDRGFNAENVLTMEVLLAPKNYSQAEGISRFFTSAAQQIATIPQVTSAAFTSLLPLSGSNRDASFTIEGNNHSQRVPRPDEEIRMITPDYFQVLQTPLREGRFFTPSDTADSPSVVIVNEALAQRYWPADNALGKRIALNNPAGPPRWRMIVGIVGDIRHRGLDEPARPEFYLPHAQEPYPLMVLAVRSARISSDLVSAIREKIHSLNPSLPLAKVRTLKRIVADSTAPRRLIVVLVGTFASVAVLLTSVGFYGVMSYLVLERKQEIAVRMALGAQPRSIFWLLAAPSFRLLLLGTAVGLLAAACTSPLLIPLLYDVAPFDPGTVLYVLAFLVMATLLATYIPIRRATRADLIVALGHN